MEKINEVKFGVAGGVAGIFFTAVVELFLWFRFVPQYDALFQSTYGVSYAPQIMKTFIIIALAILVLSFVSSWIFAKVYNNLQRVKVK